MLGDVSLSIVTGRSVHYKYFIICATWRPRDNRWRSSHTLLYSHDLILKFLMRSDNNDETIVR